MGIQIPCYASFNSLIFFRPKLRQWLETAYVIGLGGNLVQKCV